MRVLFLHQQPCIRTLKHGVGLRAARPELVLGYAYRGRTLSELYGAGDELFDVWWRLGEDLAGDLRDVVAAFAPDVIHSHNLPDLLTVLALEVTEGGVPVVHDVHDLQSLRRTPYEDGFPDTGDLPGLECRAVEGCAALVTVSEELLEEIGARHSLPARTLVVHNHALARDLPAALPDPDRPAGDPLRLVYQGSLSTSGGHYDLRGIFAALAEEGLELHVHPAKAVPG